MSSPVDHGAPTPGDAPEARQPTLASYGLAILVGCCLCASLLSSLL